MTYRLSTLLSLLVSLGLGCSAGSDEEDPAEHACEEREEAGTAITASMAPDSASPEVEVGGEPVTVAVDGTGYVRIVTTEDDEDIVVFADASALVTGLLLDGGGSTSSVPLVSAGPNTFCPSEIAEHFDVELETAGTYYLELTGTGNRWLLIGDAAGHGHAHD